MARNIVLGRAGEDAAAAHYRRLGYSLVARNWRCPLGELDLVLARRGQGGLIVFCEVKTRTGPDFGAPVEAVTWRKQRKLRTMAEAFLSSFDMDPSEVRFDVASVTLGPSGNPSVFLYEEAF